MTTRVPLLAALCALVVGAGCGDDDGPPSSQQPATTDTTAADTTSAETAPTPAETAPAPVPSSTPAPEDKQGFALLCIRNEKGIEARPIGDKSIQIGPGNDGPRIDFFQSSLEAEGEQFEGRGEGAEQIGAALLYVREAPEDQLIALEECLNDQ